MAEEQTDLKDLLNKFVNTKIDSNRRFIDQVLERIQDQNHHYYLQRLGNELREMELAQKTGNLQLVLHHKVMADTYKSILENCFQR